MNFKVFAIIAIRFLAPERESQMKTIYHATRGTVTADTKEAAREGVERKIEAFINREYPVRWNSEIKLLKLIEL